MVRSPVAAFLLSAAVASQGQVLVVDDDAGAGVDFTSLQTAIDVASEGDLILVKEGTFGLCWLDDRALTVCAEVGAVVNVERVIVSDLAPGKVVRLQGIRSEHQTSFSPCLLTGNAGRVWIEDGAFEPSSEPAFPGVHMGSAGISVTDSQSVVLVNVHARGQTLATVVPSPFGITPGRGLYASGSTVEGFGCTFDGGDGATFPTAAGGTGTTSPWETLYMLGASKVHLSACAVHGGKGGPTVEIPGYCILGTGGTGIRAACILGCSELSLQATTVVGGLGGDAPAASTCPGGQGGVALNLDPGTVLFEPSSDALMLDAPSPVGEASQLDVVLHGPPQALAFLGVSATPDALFVPSLGAPLVLEAPILGLQLGVIPATGELTLGLPLLELPPGFASLVFHGQTAYLDPQNAVVLGQPGMVVLLDASL